MASVDLGTEPTLTTTTMSAIENSFNPSLPPNVSCNGVLDPNSSGNFSSTNSSSSSSSASLPFPPSCIPIDETCYTCDKNLWSLLLLFFPVITVFGNVLVIMAVAKERNLQSVTNYFIISLAVADLLVGLLVMPLGAYYLVNTYWGLPPYICDCYIGMDVICSTSSIFNLVAISIDRYIAVTKPIRYAQHKNNNRIVFTIALVWLISIAIGIPIMAGLNDEGRHPGVCAFNNAIFIISSSTFSFYIPCLIMIYLYFRIFKAIRERAKKQAVKRPKTAEVSATTIIENVAQTKKLAETNLGDSKVSKPLSLEPPRIDEEKPTNNTSNSPEEEEDEYDQMVVNDDEENCHVIENLRAEDVLLQPLKEKKDGEGREEVVSFQISETSTTKNGMGNRANMISSVLVEEQQPTKKSFQIKKKLKALSKGNGEVVTTSTGENCPEGGSLLAKKEKKASGARFTIYKAHKASKRKREKSSAKKERKATKTLAIVLGAFLVCWVPFFTCNILDAVHKLLDYDALDPGATAFLFTTWLGYMNSFLNPVIYTIFNPEFRKAFKKILTGKS